jgi:transmembrane sensor
MKIQDKNMINWELLAAYISDNLNEAQRKEVEDWLAASEENRKVLDQARKVWDKVSGSKDEQPDANLAWEKVSAKTGIDNSTKTKTRFLNTNFFIKVAAVVLIIVGIRVFGPLFKSEKLAETSADKRLQIELSDGSIITLNHSSSLKYPQKFSGNTREVTLLGEAFFSIARNEKKPFIIHTGNSAVKVLGTSFNINNCGKGQVEVVVSSGIVAFYSKAGITSEKPVVLTKNDKLVYTGLNGKISKSINDDPNYFSWKTGKFIFRETKLSEVFGKIEDFYGIKIVVTNDAINKYRFTSTFDNQPVENIMNVLKLAFGLDIKHEGKEYLVTGK